MLRAVREVRTQNCKCRAAAALSGAPDINSLLGINAGYTKVTKTEDRTNNKMKMTSMVEVEVA